VGAGATFSVSVVHRAATLVAATVLFVACGIESTPFIAGPKPDEVDFVLETARITFLHNENDNDTDEFKGYELYYRLYEDTLGVGCGENASCEADYNYILNDPVQTGPSRLLGRDYRKMVKNDAPGDIPNIPVSNGNKGSEFEVDIDMTAGGPQTAVIAEWPDGPVELNRAIPTQGNPGIYKSFLVRDEYVTGDNDVDHMANDILDVINNDSLYAAVYALGYGIDPGSLQSLYSEPVFLGYVRLEPQ
jgi:hypothetical protein